MTEQDQVKYGEMAGNIVGRGGVAIFIAFTIYQLSGIVMAMFK